MIYTIENKVMKIAVDTSGAQLASVQTKPGRERIPLARRSRLLDGQGVQSFPHHRQNV